MRISDRDDILAPSGCEHTERIIWLHVDKSIIVYFLVYNFILIYK